ncbi:MAG: Gfo/Idh/MocA family oxidoreductase [Candidatus Marinimicrobia bacterium]|nr:Gfo/Idh/MocA family oxidoreductase [Candidatus Neomarinimicrobiota bacterium]
MNTINTGIIGCGFMGYSHIENLRRVPNVNIQAVADISAEKSKELAQKYNISKTYKNWQKLVEDPDIEVIHNCTPNHMHYKINKKVIQEGKAILSEKPLTNSEKESAELLKLAKDKDVLTGVNFNYRNYPLIRHARKMIENGELGEIYLIHGHYLQDWLLYKSDYNWRVEKESGGPSRAIADIGSHWCDMIQFLTGKNITRVFADLSTIHKTRLKPRLEADTFQGKEKDKDKKSKEVVVKTEDAGILIFQMEEQVKGVFNVSQVSAGHKNCFDIEINGSQMSVAWEQEQPNKLWMGYRDKPNQELVKDPALLNTDSKSFAHYPGGHPEGYPDVFKNMFITFYQAFRKNKTIKDKVNFATFKDGYQENRIVEAILQSNNKQSWIDLI